MGGGGRVHPSVPTFHDVIRSKTTGKMNRK
ncbi:hypothetical protein CAEBREN_12598 [Caenorhabditis brenneri]|uniref:Uncharacterized protein n=1 Tax=Caenorhabditis brenneri TaxID=135651 RepID=G0MN06_CAEBE|nr:hypothetical protein CAEBREN_12598 [Caenorhabditis brenneri]